ncbi:unnamed protein product [Urochloa decumbens]|uniref:Glycosyltransferase n=1 Tax=Urochloa decumbens TaxID=240449 RepID=A0ABC9DP78_9POAL
MVSSHDSAAPPARSTPPPMARRPEHFLFVTDPMQSHINPARRLASRVAALLPSARVTFSTAVSGHRHMFPHLTSPDGEVVQGLVSYIPYSDGFDAGFKFDPNAHGVADAYGERARVAGPETLAAVFARLAGRGRPVTRVVYTALVGGWAPAVARAHGAPAALYWVKPATVFAVYYHYFHGHGDEVLLTAAAAAVRLPGLPSLAAADLPSFALCVEVFQPNDARAYLDWLDTKPARSVVFVSLGSVVSVSKRQDEELRRGLEATGRPYLLVARKSGGVGDGRGMVVEWCSETKVLCHGAVGCFVTHCRWDAALESIAGGVPMVAVPRWGDQPTVAALVEATAGVGVRARVDDSAGGVFGRDELRRCVEMVMGSTDGAAAVRARAERWGQRANEAAARGGTSERGLRAFASSEM